MRTDRSIASDLWLGLSRVGKQFVVIAKCLTRKQVAPRWLDYKADGRDNSGLLINEIIHQSPRGAIYLTPGAKPSENLTWDEQPNLGRHWTRSTAEAINLITPVKTTIRDRSDRRRALKMLAAGLSRAMEKRWGEPDEDFLAEAREFIQARQLEVLQLLYLVSAVVTTAVVTACLASIAWYAVRPREFLVASLLAGSGALVSVSRRFRSISVERDASRRFTAISGGSRIVFGCIFGAVFLLLQKAGILVGNISENPFFLHAAAFVAGFSERLIPEVLEKFESRITGGNSANEAEDTHK